MAEAVERNVEPADRLICVDHAKLMLQTDPETDGDEWTVSQTL